MIVYQNQNSGKKYHFHSAYSENYYMAAHLHDFTEVIYVKSGCLTVKMDGERYDVKEGEAVIVLPNRIHEYISEKENSVCGVIFSNDFIPIFFDKIGNSLPEYPVYKVSDKTLWTEKLLRVNRRDYLNIASLLYELCGDAEKNIVWTERKSENGALIQEAINFISDNFRENITLSDLAKKLGYNEKYLSYTLHTVTNMNFRRLLSSYRINFAKEVISETAKRVSMVDVALGSGFSSLASFNRNFREIEGISPSEYRKRKSLGILK